MRYLSTSIVFFALAGSAPAQWIADSGPCASGQCPRVLPPAPLAAEAVGPPANARAVVRVVNELRLGRALGTGTLVDVSAERAIVVTCAHLFRDGVGTLSVVFADGHSVAGQLAKIDARADLAAVTIGPTAVEPVALATDSPQQGDLLVACGLGGDGQLRCQRGRALGYVVAVGSHGTETLEMIGGARSGDSGGPMLNHGGQLVAVIFGTNGRVIDGTFCGRVRQFLAELRAQPAPPAAPDVGAPPPQHGPNTQAQPVTPAAPAPAEKPTGAAAADPAAPDGDSDEHDAIEHGADALEAVARPWLTARVAALLVSVGVPGGIAGLAAGAAVWLIMRRGRQRLKTEIERLRSANAQGADVAEGTADAAVVERHHNRYVPYEETVADKAWAAAHAHVGERYPGAVPYLKLVEGVKEQLLSGIKQSQLT